MKCLAVNTATSIFSIALVDGEKVLHYFETPETRDQGNLLIGRIQLALKENNIGFSDLDLLAVVTGPGSFTGIRVGLAAMRGIALAADKPLVGITSFDMFASPKADAVNVVAVESLRSELYFAVLDEDRHPLIGCANETPAVLLERFRKGGMLGYEMVFSGDAAAVTAEMFGHVAEEDSGANAVRVAALALERFKAGGAAERPLPYYLREADVTISAKTSRKVCHGAKT